MVVGGGAYFVVVGGGAYFESGVFEYWRNAEKLTLLAKCNKMKTLGFKPGLRASKTCAQAIMPMAPISSPLGSCGCPTDQNPKDFD